MSASYLPTYLNGIQVVIEFDWNVNLNSSLYIKRFMSQARQYRGVRAKREADEEFTRRARRARRAMRGEKKKTNIFGNTFLLNFWLEFQTY